jgi:hypothetical protein
MTRFHLTRRAAIVGAAVAAVAAGGAAAALATSSTSGDVYQGCLSHSLGALYNVKVNPSAPPRCLSHDTLVKWNQTGPAGTPGATGPAGPQGLKGDNGAAGSDGATGPAGPQGAKGDSGAAGPKGDAGPEGPAGTPGSGGFSTPLHWVQADFSVGHTASLDGSDVRDNWVGCQAGEHVYGGGYWISPTDLDVRVEQSAPNGDRTRWYVSYMNDDARNATLTVFVLCGAAG